MGLSSVESSLISRKDRTEKFNLRCTARIKAFQHAMHVQEVKTMGLSCDWSKLHGRNCLNWHLKIHGIDTSQFCGGIYTQWNQIPSYVLYFSHSDPYRLSESTLHLFEVRVILVTIIHLRFRTKFKMCAPNLRNLCYNRVIPFRFNQHAVLQEGFILSSEKCQIIVTSTSLPVPYNVYFNW